MMIRILPALLSLAAVPVARAQHATATWEAAAGWQAGKPVETAIRVKMESPWHIYWTNPGEGGLETEIKVTAPAGWTVDGPHFPVPKRFKTGELSNFGYEDEVLFPIRLIPGPAASGDASFSAEISWLACNEDACVPGEAKPTLTLTRSDLPEPYPASAEITKAFSRVPAPTADPVLSVAESGDQLVLTLRSDRTGAWENAEVFPQTHNVIDPAAPIRFAKSGATWTATVPRSSYAEGGAVRDLALVLAPGNDRPVLVKWAKPR